MAGIDNAPQDPVRSNLGKIRKDLLDFGLRNPLLNFRHLSSRGLEVSGMCPADLYKSLVAAGQDLPIKLPSEKRAAADRLTESKATPTAEPGNIEGLKRRGISTPYSREELSKRLLGTYYAARTSIEEQGVNSLFLAIGSLLWREPRDRDELRRAPLILIPIALNRSEVRENFAIRYNGDEVVSNLSLSEFLSQSFGINAPKLSDDEEIDPAAYFEAFSKCISAQKDWQIDSAACAIGFFSFSKFLMFADLDIKLWGDKLADHRLLKALLGTASLTSDSSAPADDVFVDDLPKSNTIPTVLDADSTQMLAILDVAAGRDVVVQGPPGCGKSQTIVNLIAACIATHKKVLFVAEKKAALEVVKRRLDQLGLGDACLELHSNKTRKQEVIENLKRTANLAYQGAGTLGTTSLAVLDQARKSLTDYCNAVNSIPGETGESVYELFGQLLPLLAGLAALKIPVLRLEHAEDWTRADVAEREQAVSQLQGRVEEAGLPVENSFWGSTLKIALPSTLVEAKTSLQNAADVANLTGSLCRQIADIVKDPLPQNEEGILALKAYAETASAAPVLDGVDPTNRDWSRHALQIKAALDSASRWQELRKKWKDLILPKAWTQNMQSYQETLKRLAVKLLPVSFSLQWKPLKISIQNLCSGYCPETFEELKQVVATISAEHDLRSKALAAEPHMSLLYGEEWLTEDTDLNLMLSQLNWIVSSQSSQFATKLTAEFLAQLHDAHTRRQLQTLSVELSGSLNRYASAMRHICSVLALDMNSDASIVQTVKSGWTPSAEAGWRLMAENVSPLQAFCAYRTARDCCSKLGLESVAAIADRWAASGTDLLPLFRYARISALLEEAFTTKPALARFDSKDHSRLLATFREMDVSRVREAARSIAQSHITSLPRLNAGNGQAAVLRREFEKKARHLPLRSLFSKAGNVIQAIKPVLMMSPLSVANFLPPSAIDFDIVIFDEASQIRPADAFGAIARSRQAVVVGDSKQLPPTSFFESLVSPESDSMDEDASTPPTADLESILGLFCACGAQQRMLRWHYRSQHESLIAGSNHLFYDDRLVVFPSPEIARGSVGLSKRQIDNSPYDRAKTRTNPGEARAVAEAVMKHAAEQIAGPSAERLSLGVVALSVAQRDAILDQVELLRHQSPQLEPFFSEDQREPFFCKNLENVQGDERSVIFISIGYGRTQDGTLTMSFGPVNRAGGERRLNVLFSRARLRCEVFTSLLASDIDTSGPRSAGLYALKTFLRLAEGQGFEKKVISDDRPDSPFEEEVANALRRRGFIVHTQVGSAGYSIDLAIVDPENADRYLLGIECDGRAYHGAQSARDRDRLRQQVLESIGWKIYRIWSTAWFRSVDKELNGLLGAIDAAMSNDRTAPKSQLAPIKAVGLPETPRRTTTALSASDGLRSVPYRIAQLNIQLDGLPLRLETPETLRGWIASVVEVESPIHWSEAVRRVACAAGLRLTPRVQAVLRRACREGIHAHQFSNRGMFLWKMNSNGKLSVRNRCDFPPLYRRLDLVAPEELDLAIIQSVSDSFGMSEDDLAPEVALLLGFPRVSDEMKTVVAERTSALRAAGRLGLKRGILVPQALC